MSEECVIAIYNTIDPAKEAVLALKESGFPSDQMSLATKTLKLEAEVREAIEFGDEMAKDAAIGAGAGALLAVFAEATAVAITGMGAFLVAGPIVMGAIVGGLMGAANGWGVHKDHIPVYEKKLHEGKVLLIAHGDPVNVALADRILQGTDPLELHLHAESSADAPEIERT
ncbi:MAG: hypothetical protein RIK87_24980 [Fuerstiella sp.]